MLLSRRSQLLLVSLGIMASSVAQAWQQDRSYRFTILHTNDHHGHFWHNQQGEYGLAAQKTLMDKLRYDVQARGGATLILSGGDINTGVPESDLQDAEPDFRGMNLVGYDAMALGNHEFDNTIAVLRQQEKWARFPLLSANIYSKSTGERLFKPWAVFNRMGLNIAVIGLTTDDTAKLSDPGNTKGIEFRDPIKEAQLAADTLRATEKPDVIIALTHMGHYENGQHGSNAPGDVEMARTLPKGTLDIIIGGHSQDAVCMEKENVRIHDYQPGSPCKPDQQNGVWIMQAKEWGKYVGRGDFTFRNGKLTLNDYQLVPVNLKRKVKNADGSESLLNWGENIPHNSAMMKLLTPYQKRGEAQINMTIGEVSGNFIGERDKVRFEQTNLGQLILKAQIDAAKSDLAVMSGGGVRTSLNEGPLKYRDILEVQPFANQLVYVDLKGSELEQYLAKVVNISPGSGGYAQLANVTLVADGHQISEIKINGQPLDPEKTYRLATNSFNASGGDNYPDITGLPGYVNTGRVDAEVLKAWIEQHPDLKAKDYTPSGIVTRSEKP